MNPSDHILAGREAANIVRNRLRRVSGATKKRRIERAATIAEVIWRRWHVGVYRWRLKHVRWFLEHAAKSYTDHTRYQYWLVLRSLIERTGRDHWTIQLHGPWVRPVPVRNVGDSPAS